MFMAAQFAGDGVEQAAGLIKAATGDTNYTWSSQAGKITRFPKDAGAGEAVLLSSGSAGGGPNGVNLNGRQIFRQGEGMISSSTEDRMDVAWIYVRQDGTRSANTNYDASNRIIGRYSFWVDDESAKINLNTAWTKESDNTNSRSHASRVSLTNVFDGITMSQVEDLVAGRSVAAFNTQFDVMRSFGSNSTPDLYGPVRNAKFWTTHYNNSPASDLTAFGEPKFVLTTQSSRVGINPRTGTLYPYFNTSNIGASILLLNSYLARTDWYMAPGKSYQEKYFDSQSARLTQLSLNIFEYVRFKESADLRLKPTRMLSTDNEVYSGMTRRPKIVEMGIWRNQSAPATGRYYILLYFPKNLGTESFELSGWQMQIQIGNAGVGAFVFPSPTAILAGEYYLISYAAGVPAGATLQAKIVLTTETGDLIDFYPVGSVLGASSLRIPVPVTELPPVSGGQPDLSAIATVKVDDPFLGGRPQDWKSSTLYGGHLNTLLARDRVSRASKVGQPPENFEDGQDLAVDGTITDEGVVIPAPRGTIIANSPSSNPRGIVESLGELGYIHSGAQPPGSSLNAVPFRTLRFQPRHPSASRHLGSVPDWALMDIFALPNDVGETGSPYAPRAGLKGGLVNLNTEVYPFTNVIRSRPLRGVFEGISGYTQSQVDQLLAKVNLKELSDNSISKGKIPDSQAYRSVGEVIEVSGVADAGESSEEAVRNFIGLLTIRSNVFSVYSVGQSVVQTPSGEIVVRGELRVQAMLERRDGTPETVRLLYSRRIGF